MTRVDALGELGSSYSSLVAYLDQIGAWRLPDARPTMVVEDASWFVFVFTSGTQVHRVTVYGLDHLTDRRYRQVYDRIEAMASRLMAR